MRTPTAAGPGKAHWTRWPRAAKRMSGEVHSWRIHLRSGTELEDIAAWINPVVRGWTGLLRQVYRTALNGLLQRINTYLVRWAKRK